MMAIVLRILALTRKELLAILKDPRGRFSIFVPPILQTLLFGYAATFDLNDVNYAVLDQDKSSASRAILSRIEGSAVFQQVASLNNISEWKRLVEDRKALMLIQVDQNFERNLIAGRPAILQVIADGRNSNTASTAIGYIVDIVMTFNAGWRADHQMPPIPITTIDRAWFNPNLESRWNMIPGLIGTLTMMQIMLLTTMSVAREREEGTWDQLLVTPFRPVEIMAGKAIPSMTIGIVQSTMILLVAQLWFRIPFAGSFAMLYFSMGIFLAAAVGIGLLVSSYVATMQQAMLFSFVLILPFVLLSGLVTPVNAMPPILQKATIINPLRFAVDFIHAIYLEGGGFHRVGMSLVGLSLMAAATLSMATWRFSRRLS